MPFASNDIYETSFRELFETYKNRLYGYIYAITHSHHSAEELTQEIFIKLWICRHDLHHIGNLDGYIFKIAKHKTLNYLRKAAYDDKLLKELHSHMVGETGGADERLNIAEYERLLSGAVNALSAQRRLVYQLSRTHGYTLDQIAEQLNLSRNTVKNHLVDALKLIREHFIRHGSGSMMITCFLLC